MDVAKMLCNVLNAPFTLDHDVNTSCARRPHVISSVPIQCENISFLLTELYFSV